MIAIIDYGLGNVKAFANVYKNLNIPVVIAKQVDDLNSATKIILPGVGAFDHAMTRLNNSGMRSVIEEKTLNRQVPLLGVCVGMQILARSSEEGSQPGLGWIDGEVKRFNPLELRNNTLLPHMGWNDINPRKADDLLNSINHDARFYFLHSYYMHCNNEEDILATTDYGGLFTSAVNSKNIYGVQFHPEKSHQWGIQLLKNFALI